MSTTSNTNQVVANASYVVNRSNGDVKVIVSNQKQEESKKQVQQPISGFAKNTRYSIYNNGGGYTGL
jgi:hypothetical protein